MKVRIQKSGFFYFYPNAPRLDGQSESPPLLLPGKIDEGFEFKAVQLNGPSYQTRIKLQVLRVDLEKFSVRSDGLPGFGIGRMAIRKLAQKSQA